MHEALLKAKEKQTGRTFVKPQEKILLYAMERQMQLCQGKMEELQQENEKLKQENERLRKIIQEQSLKIIKGL